MSGFSAMLETLSVSYQLSLYLRINFIVEGWVMGCVIKLTMEDIHRFYFLFCFPEGLLALKNLLNRMNSENTFSEGELPDSCGGIDLRFFSFK